MAAIAHKYYAFYLCLSVVSFKFLPLFLYLFPVLSFGHWILKFEIYL
jgi:hypothetical protein